MEEPCCIPGTGAPGCPKGKQSITMLDPDRWLVSELMVTLASGGGMELRVLLDESGLGWLAGGRSKSCCKMPSASASSSSAISSLSSTVIKSQQKSLGYGTKNPPRSLSQGKLVALCPGSGGQFWFRSWSSDGARWALDDDVAAI